MIRYSIIILLVSTLGNFYACQSGQSLQNIEIYQVQLIKDKSPTQIELNRFRVSSETARTYAHNYIVSKHLLSGPITECLYLPKTDSEGLIFEHFFVFSNLEGIDSLSELKTHAETYRKKALLEFPETTGRSQLTNKLHHLSASNFYTISISALSYKAPLKFAHHGLPHFIIEPATIKILGRPQSIVICSLDKDHEAIVYHGPDAKLVYSHHSHRQILPEMTLKIDLARSLKKWADKVTTINQQDPTALQRHNLRWQRHL
jgi:hypothetical protein